MKTIYANANKIRCRILAWMREPEWKWHIVHTDYMDELMPKFHLFRALSWVKKHMNLGADTLNNPPNGPND